MTTLRFCRALEVAALIWALAGCSASRSESWAGSSAPVDSVLSREVDEVQPPPASADSIPAQANWFTADSSGKAVTLDLEVMDSKGAASALINRHRAGELRVVVPLNWTVNWNWRNADSTSPHSLVVMVQREKIPTEGGRPAFTNAMSRAVTEGLAPGQTDRTTFQAEEAGWYWILCGVPGHALKGEWIELRVDPEAKTGSVQTKGER